MQTLSHDLVSQAAALTDVDPNQLGSLVYSMGSKVKGRSVRMIDLDDLLHTAFGEAVYSISGDQAKVWVDAWLEHWHEVNHYFMDREDFDPIAAIQQTLSNGMMICVIARTT